MRAAGATDRSITVKLLAGSNLVVLRQVGATPSTLLPRTDGRSVRDTAMTGKQSGFKRECQAVGAEQPARSRDLHRRRRAIPLRTGFSGRKYRGAATRWLLIPERKLRTHKKQRVNSFRSRPAIMCHDRGLATSPGVRYSPQVEGSASSPMVSPNGRVLPASPPGPR